MAVAGDQRPELADSAEWTEYKPRVPTGGAHATGHYRKIGKTVHVRISIDNPPIGGFSVTLPPDGSTPLKG